MIRALLLVSTPERRGAEVFATELSTLLDAHGVAATVMAIGPGSGPGLDIEVIGSAGARSPVTLARLSRVAQHQDVLVSNGGTTLIPTAIAAELTRTPFVYRNIGDPTVWGRARFSGLRIGAPLRRAAALAALSPQAAAVLAQRYRVRTTAITVIPNAARADQFPVVTDDRRREARAHLGLSDDRRWVAYVGALSEEKRPLLAIDAVAADPRLGLVVAGDGPLRDACRVAGDRATDGAVKLLGSVPDVAAVYAAVDAVVISSRTEGIPAAAIEGGMSGLPVVATDVGGLAHVVDDGRTGLLVSDPTPTDLAAALNDAIDRRVDLGTAAAARCRSLFSMDVVAAQWAELLHDAVRGR